MRRAVPYFAAAALLLLPCYWQPQIYAGDLSSHLYNAWLATLIEKGQAPGLVIHPMNTNIFFDVMLEWLLKLTGVTWAQRIAASVVVLVFASGLFVFLEAISGKPPWFLFPAVLMLSYGWIFRMGFFNFLMSLGFALMVLALVIKPTGMRMAFAILLLALAWIAHFMPAAWAAAMAVYYLVMRRLQPRRRLAMLALAIAIVALTDWGILANFRTERADSQQSHMTGADQFWTSKGYTAGFAAAMLLAWGLLFQRLTSRKAPLRILMGFPAHCAILAAAAALLIPDAIAPKGAVVPFEFVANRFSMLVAVAVCAMLASARPRRSEIALLALCCAAFLAQMYIDGRDLNRREHELTHLVESLPAGARVVSLLNNGDHIDQWAHLIDRVCVNRCFSYANYEPGTGLFRVRVAGPTSIVTPDPVTTAAVLKQRPPPGTPGYYEISLCTGTLKFCLTPVNPTGIRALPEGQPSGGFGHRDLQNLVHVPDH